MKSIFLDSQYKEIARIDSLFGLCDDFTNKAYSDNSNEETWIAIVKNESGKEIVFTPIDNCIKIYKPNSKDVESTCDGMLTFSDTIFLVELKVDGMGGWKSEAIGQLENTMKLMKSDESIQIIKKKKAYACNKKHPNFQTVDPSLKKSFFCKYGFRIHVGAEINIK